MTKEQLHQAAIGDYCWVYHGTYSGKVERWLGRVIEHPSEDLTEMTVVQLQEYDWKPSVNERTFSGNEDDIKFGLCDTFNAQRWLIDNGVEPNLRKLVSEKEAEYQVAMGFSNTFAAMTGKPQLRVAKESVLDEASS